jgi:peptide chain release factor 3
VDVIAESRQRRTFAIISHPDAGKTTLTEKFLLYSGAVQVAGAVHAREGRRSARSDWMELEQQRGISISSTVMQFPYRAHGSEHIMNLLDTPGHRDFSEDTYRVLAAVDAVVMVLDAAKGIESQTLKLFQVCRSRNLPVITFLNKYDRPGREPLELLDEIEQQIKLRPTPVTWPVGSGDEFQGLIDRRDSVYTRFTRTARGASAALEETLALDAAVATAGPGEQRVWKTALDELGLLDAVGADLDLPSFLAGESTPLFIGSALTNFGVRKLLDAVVDLAPPPSPRADNAGNPHALDEPFSAFVFKVQANMDPSHRDRIAFARICSGHFQRGMSVTNARTDRDMTTKYATTAFGPERETVEDAFPGDVVGLVNATGVQLGDTLYEAGSRGQPVDFPPIPRFAPEVFARARPLDNAKAKQFRKGLEQLDEEGVVQVLRDPDMGESENVLAAVGQLQFEVFAHRLGSEFGAPTEIVSAPYQAIRLTDKQSAERLRQIGGIRILTRGDGALCALFENRYRLQRLIGDEPELRLEPIIADAGVL